MISSGEINRIINELKTLRLKNKTLKNENKNLQSIDEKCKKLIEENEKLLIENKELTEKNDKLVSSIYRNPLYEYIQMNNGMEKSLKNLNIKIDNCLNLLKINFISSDSDIYKMDKIVSASENLKKIQQ